MQLEWDENSADRPIDQWDNWCAAHDRDTDGNNIRLPLVAVRRRMDINCWEVAIYGESPIWKSMPNVNSREEAKVAAMAMWRMK